MTGTQGQPTVGGGEADSGGMIAWRAVPWPLWIFCAFTAVLAVVFAVVPQGPIGPRVGAAVFFLAWAFVLLLGIRWIWVATLVVLVLGLVPWILSGGATWYGAVVTIVEFSLLLHPQTRAFYRTGRARSSG